MDAILHKTNNEPRQRNRALLLTAAGAAVLVALPLHSASAEEIDAPAALLSDVAPVSDAELAENRGGFSIGNMNFNIGLTVTTAIQGPNINPISVTTNYSVDTGNLTNLGTTISNQVNNTLAQSGIGGGSKDNQDKAPETQSASNFAVGNVSNPDPPPSDPKPSNSNTPDNPVTTQLAQNTGPQNPGDNGKSSLNVQSNTQGTSISITNPAGTNVNVSADNGLLTTVTNTMNDVTIQTKVDLNFALNNYHNVIQNAQAFQQAMNLAQQMLAIRGIAGH